MISIVFKHLLLVSILEVICRLTLICRLNPLQYLTGLKGLQEGTFQYKTFPSAESFKNGCCQLQAKVCAQSTG